ncbi:MAG: acetyl-CoA carboxylase carboxyltransferase subunit alpha [Armatimonadetes bacterium CG2_30_59_28]|nr:acetyl-CoA carboxylase carboxyltransferase subunit alpha [Armatimonadota bacterium]OIO89908.1 MAG: acetyl-CoA carboxylase carboxyltransferase subunit alpha [Armatimonadetes bacterium CG2_30_59_28]PIU60465.1 MAG: acetyl-CoA carboxylase carboxyl transferase subunit alpha [Armatimonadetes bacterium CG07_land_8_20_14_0_80_59_28]PJB65978.1 MAG: acetyl-CoA carboxylase carboxyl transferase subunit alpha [Armatimonadetes bacterium CG_4_9_14_3_um_filter_58_7]
MLSRWLPIEKPLVEIEQKIEELTRLQETKEIDSSVKLSQLCKKRDRLIPEIFSKMTPWDKVLMARHPQRPYALDYINAICGSYFEMHGDRRYGDDPAIVSGLGRLDERSVAIIGHQKGRDTKERQFRNFGSAMPEGYRKAVRVMQLANTFGKPIVCLVDTPAAACLTEAEERGISEAIARSQMEMFTLRVPVIVIVIGEGGSGGAIGIAVGNRVFMLEYAIYSVIPPEGCASIIWRDSSRAAEAAAALKVTAQDALRFGIADEIIPEPPGGAHRNFDTMALTLKTKIIATLDELGQLSPEELEESRYQRFRKLGVYQQTVEKAVVTQTTAPVTPPDNGSGRAPEEILAEESVPPEPLPASAET